MRILCPIGSADWWPIALSWSGHLPGNALDLETEELFLAALCLPSEENTLPPQAFMLDSRRHKIFSISSDYQTQPINDSILVGQFEKGCYISLIIAIIYVYIYIYVYV